MLTLLLFLGVGAVAGLIAGLFGVGGGLVIVPVLVWVFTAHDFAEPIIMQLAVGSSLATIVVTSLSSVRTHHQLGNINWRCFAILALGITAGVWLGADTAAAMAGRTLKLAFGAFAVLVAIQMGMGLKPKPSRDLPGAPVLVVVGGGIGFVSSLFGIGGGSLTVPYLSWCNVKLQRAVGTSAACGLPIAIVGAAKYSQVGWQQAGLPEYSTGYVYWPAVLGIVLTSTLFARQGALLAQRLPERVLKRSFALFLLTVGGLFFVQNF